MKLKKLIKYMDKNEILRIVINKYDEVTITDYVKYIEDKYLEFKISKIEYENNLIKVILENQDYNEIFDNLVKFLKKNKYEVEIMNSDIYRFASVRGNGIVAGFASKHDETDLYANYYYNNIITVDNERSYNKPSKCPLHLELPKNKKELNILLDKLKFWGSEIGYNKSNDFEKDEDSLIL